MMQKNRLMTLEEVLLETRMGKTKLYKLIKESRFPPQRRLGDGSSIWIRIEIDYWVDCLIDGIEYQYKKVA